MDVSDVNVTQDVSRISSLDVDVILKILQQRFGNKEYYTFLGDILLAVNPYTELHIYDATFHEKYSDEPTQNEPHIYWVAEQVYRKWHEMRLPQCVLVSGESGAGKTETTKHFVNHIAYMSSAMKKGQNNISFKSLHEKIVRINPLLESFGNAGTIMNDNSSRFGKYLELHFTSEGFLSGASVQEYMLEKSRVIHRNPDEKNFHIFYYLFAGFSKEKLENYYLGSLESYRIMHSSFCRMPEGSNHDSSWYQARFEEQLGLMMAVGFTDVDISVIMALLSAILNLTNIEFLEDRDTEGVQIADDFPLRVVCKLLSVDIDDLTTALVSNTVFIRGEEVTFLKKRHQAGEGRDALAKAIYSRLFGWIVAQVNVHLQPTKRRSCDTIGILDISGFEKLYHNGFEQLCINTANERLQQFFIDAVFQKELTEYKEQLLNTADIQYSDNQPVIDLLLKKPTGVFCLIEEESSFPQATDSTLALKLHKYCTLSPHYLQTHGQTDTFTIQHYAGEVTYDCAGILERNRDTLSSRLVECLVASSDELISALFCIQVPANGSLSSVLATVTARPSLNMCLDQGRLSRDQNGDSITKATATRIKHRRNNSLELPITDYKVSTFVSRQFRTSLDELVEKLSEAKPWFVKCISPNNERSPVLFDENLVRKQLKCNGILEVAQLRRDGYAVRMTPEEFVRRFHGVINQRLDEVSLTFESCVQILVEAGIADYAVGKTKIFLRHWHESLLRDLSASRQITAPVDLPSPSASSSPMMSDNDVYSRKPDEMPSLDNSVSRVADWINTSTDNLQSYKLKTPQIESQAEILDSRLWDRFQMMPRDKISQSEMFQPALKFFKVVCYLFLFCVVLGSAVINKICVLFMTSSVTKDGLPESQWPAKTMLVISMCFPYSLWLLVYSAKSLFGSTSWPSFSTVSLILFIELLHSFGLSLLVFRVLPLTDMVRGLILLSSIHTVPALLKTVFEAKSGSFSVIRRFLMGCLNSVALFIQIASMSAALMFSIVMTREEKSAFVKTLLDSGFSTEYVERPPLSEDFNTIHWELPLGLILVSLAFWENFVDADLKICGFNLKLQSWKRHIHHSRPRIYIFASVWKALWTITFAVLLQTGFNFNLAYSSYQNIAHNSSDASVTFQEVTALPSSNSIKAKALQQNSSIEQTVVDNPLSENAVLEHLKLYGVLYLQLAVSTFLTYSGSLACKMCMQIIGFTVPLLLATPTTVVVLLLQCRYQFLPLPSGPFVWVCMEAGGVRLHHLLWLGVLWLTELFINSHLWFPENGRMVKNDRLFIAPLRCGILTDQSLMLRRRRNDQDYSVLNGDDDMAFTDSSDVHRADDVVPHILACATMWHETKSEMTQLLQSIFRMDIDHSARYLAQKFYKIRDPDFYEFEAHIFFDDAMELSDDNLLVPNMFVADLMDCIDDALSAVHERQMSLGPPVKTPTPYGGRLTWSLPGGTRLTVHLKDKHKIRHKKRWSQVMYMYYLLGYRILAQPENLLKKGVFEEMTTGEDFSRVKLTNAQLRRRRKAAHFSRSVIFNYVADDVHCQAENTYILTLDGDVDFNPDAVRLLVDRLKSNKKVGAACGRIHPTGSGPLVWYQEFEYAIGHWLQKATEHVFGCVMCSPGCFSLFRGSAMMDDNVIRTYATRATEAGHYVQYDQGEDRWLSTLLLQQGYRIEYCAAADALTHAPETFSEFFNQRRRWGPSTLANVVDLLGNWKTTVRLNDNVSTPYILYQFCLLVSTVLGPATILLMMAGAFTAVFKTTVLQSYALSLIPAILFIILCINAKPSTQVTVASIMSACYAIVMTIVLVGTIAKGIEGGLTSPNVVFVIILVVIFLTSAVFHPEEFFCVVPGALYFICLPTGYLVLTIYFLCNMHIVSWGTREIPQRRSREEIEEERRIAEEKRKKKELKRKGIFGWLGLSAVMHDMAEMFKQMKAEKSTKNRTDELLEELIVEMRQSQLVRKNQSEISKPPCLSKCVQTNSNLEIGEGQNGHNENRTADEQVPVWLNNEDPQNPSWLRSHVCGNGPIKRLDDKESVFWKQIISKYLHPISEDKVHQDKVASDLKNLRNNVVFGFFMTSALWVALSIQLQFLQENLKNTLFFTIPRINMGSDLTFEPLGLIFLSFFTIILVVQFVGMFAHRWGTVLHMLSVTDISCGKKFSDKDKIRDVISKAMELQKLSNIENEHIPDYFEPIPDYDPGTETDEELLMDDTDLSSSTVASVASLDPPSYHSHDVIPTNVNDSRQGHVIRHRKRNIFNRQGFSTGKALLRAFEMRYRNRRYEMHNLDIPEEENRFSDTEGGAVSVV